MGSHRIQGKAIAEELVDEGALALDDTALFYDQAGEHEIGEQQDGDQTVLSDPICQGAHSSEGERRGWAPRFAWRPTKSEAPEQVHSGAGKFI